MESKEIKGVTFESLLNIQSLKKAILRAGKNGLDRVVTRVNVMEVPDVINWVRPKEFLVTAGYSYKENPDAFLELIPKLVDHEVSALGIKTKRFLKSVPQGAINIANQYNFPIVELAEDTSFSDVVRQVMERVLFHESMDLSLLQKRVHKFTTAILNGARLKELVSLLGGMLKNPIVLIDLSIDEVIPSEIIDDEQKKLILMLTENQFSVNSVNEQIIDFFSVPIPGRPANSSFLVLIQADHSLSNVDKLTLERISILLGIEIKNSEAQHLVETKYVDEFLYDLLIGKISSSSDIKLRAKACGVMLSEKSQYIVIILNWGKTEPLIDKLKLIRDEINHAIFFKSTKPFVTITDGQLVMILQENHLTGSLIDNFLKRIEMKPLTVHNKLVQFCIGKVVSEVQQIASSYQEAKRVKRICNICGFDNPIQSLKMLGSYRLLYLLEGHDETKKYVSEYINPLIQYDSNKKIDILSTLQAFFKCNGNLREASKNLFIHYNTLVYRLKKIESILEIDLDDPDVRFQLQIAMKLYRAY